MEGKVKFFNDSKGFGFITAEDGKDYFVHLSGIKGDLKMADGMAVKFDVEQGDRGPKAANVELAGEADSDADEPQDESAEDTEEVE